MLQPLRLCRRLCRGGILTLPNALTLLRLLLIPFFVHFFLTPDRLPAACAVLCLSALTDVLDGSIARRFHMVSDLGKFLDPLADKLTQAALLLCLSRTHRELLFLLGLFLIKECAMLSFALLTLRITDRVEGALWHGKLNTALLELSLLLLLLPGFPSALFPVLLGVCSTSMLLSLFLYTRFFARLLHRPSP